MADLLRIFRQPFGLAHIESFIPRCSEDNRISAAANALGRRARSAGGGDHRLLYCGTTRSETATSGLDRCNGSPAHTPRGKPDR